MNNEVASIADVGEMREQLHVGNELDTGVVTALQAKGEHCTAAVRDVFLSERVIFIIRETWIADPCHFRAFRQPLGDCERIAATHAASLRQYARSRRVAMFRFRSR